MFCGGRGATVSVVPPLNPALVGDQPTGKLENLGIVADINVIGGN
jgi:hypothetical protein